MLTEFGANIDQYLIKKTNDDDRDYTYIHPSEFGGCFVSMWLKMTGVKPMVPKSAGDIRLFDNGHYVHLRNQVYAKEAGVLAKDTIVKKHDPEELLIGLEPKNKILIEGSSGRKYYYSPGEVIWRVESHSRNDIPVYTGTDSAPYWDYIDNMEEGEEIWLVEVPVVDPEYHFGGHCDAIVLNNGEETIIDYKGINDYSWPRQFHSDDERFSYSSIYPDNFNSSCFLCGKNMKKAKELCEHLMSNHLDHIRIDPKYKIQLHVYMMILGLDHALLWYENKNNQIVLDCPVDRDEQLIEKIKSNAVKFWNHIEENKKPSRPTAYDRKKFPCSWCDYAFECWND